jgi:pimeloyl-ACP methyl ester carboxylesterase
VLGGLFVGYTWGWCASLLFGWAFEGIQRSTKPKLFVVGTADEFTSMGQYERRVRGLGGRLNEVAVLEGLNHFQIEAPACDAFVVQHVVSFLDKMEEQARDTAGAGEETCGGLQETETGVGGAGASAV